MDKYDFSKYVKDVIYVKNKSYTIIDKQPNTYIVVFLPYDGSNMTKQYNIVMFEIYKRILLSSDYHSVKLIQLIYDDVPIVYNDITNDIFKIRNRSFNPHEICGTMIKLFKNLNDVISLEKDNDITCIIVGCGLVLINYTLPQNISKGICIEICNDDSHIPIQDHKYHTVFIYEDIPINIDFAKENDIVPNDEFDKYKSVDEVPIYKLGGYIYLLINKYPNNIIYNSITEFVNKHKKHKDGIFNIIDVIERCVMDYEIKKVMNSSTGNIIFDKMLLCEKENINVIYDRYDKIRTKNMINNIHSIDVKLTEKEDRLIDEVYEIINERNAYKSLEQYLTALTFSNWFDEIEQEGAIGLLISISSSYETKYGLDTKSCVDSVTSSYISIHDYMDLRDSTNKYDYVPIIDDSCIGKGNIVIPLYINKYHWIYGRKYLDKIMSIATNANPFNCTKSSLRLLFKILFTMTSNCLDYNKINDAWLVSYIQLWRTCVQMASELKYNRGMKSFINNIINNPDKMLFKNVNAHKQILGQILATGIFIDDNTMKDLILFMLSEINRYEIISINGNNIGTLEALFGKKSIDKTINMLSKNMHYSNEIAFLGREIYYFLNMYKIFQKLFVEYGGFNKIIKNIDGQYGYIDTEIIKFFKNEISNIEHKNYDIKQQYIHSSFNDMFCYDIFDRLNIEGGKGFVILNFIHSLLYKTRQDKAKAITDKTYYKGHDGDYKFDINKIIEHYRKEYIGKNIE